MKFIGFYVENQKFINDIGGHLEENYIHIRHIEREFLGKLRLVFYARKDERGYVYLKGSDYYSEIGKEAYFKYIDQRILEELKHLPIFKKNKDLYKEIEIQERLPIINYISNDEHLRKLNSRRSRNFIIYRGKSMDLVYDSIDKELMFVSNAPFSDIEHDTNRKFTEEVCIDILLDFKKNIEKFTRMLSKPYDKSYISAYRKYIDILNGDSDFSEQDIFVMISILGRLNQESQMGPITVQKDYKLNPEEVSKHTTLQNYIMACISTIKEYTNIYLLNRTELKQLGNVGFNGVLERNNITPSPIPLLAYNTQETMQIQSAQPRVVGNIYYPNYIESFFRKITELTEYSNLPILIDDYKDIMDELVNFAKRYEGNTKPDFIILAHIKSILSLKKFSSLMHQVEKKILGISSRQTYYKKVAEHILSQDNEIKQREEFYKLLSIYENHIVTEIRRFVLSKANNVNSVFNSDEISIVSDMHFNNMKDIEKGNFSRNFNIVAGDFYNNSYHRAGAKITDTSLISGIGVLGNHDVNWIDNIKDIKKEIKTGYKKSISNLNKVFPEIKILNNEILYMNGVAFVGLTMVTDENSKGKRSFFANEDLGSFFISEDYIGQAKLLLDSIDSTVPVVVISHSPFKEYAVCKNKEIGVYSNKIFSNYPNVKVYVHGHGHSKQNSRIIDNVLCITNPIMNNIYNDSKYSCNWNDIGKKKYKQQLIEG